MKSLKYLGALLVAVMFMAGGERARAEPPSIDPFVGTWSGGGVAQNADSLFFNVTARDFDVVIRKEGTGFQIDWTTVIRRGGDPANPDIRRRKSSRTLVPDRDAWRCTDSGYPLDGKELCWAQVRENTLSIYLMTVEKNGGFTLQQYDRTLTPKGMELVFTSRANEGTIRTVKGQLVKTAN